MVAVDHHRRHVEESQRYYEKNVLKAKSIIKRFGH